LAWQATPSDDFRQEGLAGSRIADENDAGAFVEKIEVQKPQNTGFDFHTALMVFEVEAVDGITHVQARHTEAPFNRPAVARFQLAVRQRFDGLHQAEIFGRRVGDYLIELGAHGGEAKLIEFLM
jgi:hypothetical protein